MAIVSARRIGYHTSRIDRKGGDMEDRKYTYAQLGMLFGIFIGGGIGVVLFAISGNAVYIAVAGAGAAIGLVLGAGFDKARSDENGESE